MNEAAKWALRAVVAGYSVPIAAWLLAMAFAGLSGSDGAYAVIDVLMIVGPGLGIVLCATGAVLAAARLFRDRDSRLRSATILMAALVGVLLATPVFWWHWAKPE